MSDITKDRTRTNCGTPGYAAPEILMGIDYNYKVDIWSIGILFCEMVGGFTPFPINNEGDSPYNFAEQMIDQVNKSQLKLAKNLSNTERDLIKGILKADPGQRLEIAEIKAHGYFRGVDWD
jgi:serine/threonine protein kinase